MLWPPRTADGAACGKNFYSFVNGIESIKNYQDIFNGPQLNFGPNIRQGANSSFLAVVKGARWTRVTQPLTF